MVVAETRSVVVVVVVVGLMRVPRGLLNSSNLAALAMFAQQFPRDHRYFNPPYDYGDRWGQPFQ